MRKRQLLSAALLILMTALFVLLVRENRTPPLRPYFELPHAPARNVNPLRTVVPRGEMASSVLRTSAHHVIA